MNLFDLSNEPIKCFKLSMRGYMGQDQQDLTDSFCEEFQLEKRDFVFHKSDCFFYETFLVFSDGIPLRSTFYSS